MSSFVLKNLVIFLTIWCCFVWLFLDAVSTNFGKKGGLPYSWVSLEYAMDHSREKATMIFLHRPDSRPCQKLKKSISKNMELFNLSRLFWMVELNADYETDLGYMKFDGNYVPRVFFLDKYGRVIKEASNRRRSNMIYYYEEVDHILDTIHRLTGKKAPTVHKQDL